VYFDGGEAGEGFDVHTGSRTATVFPDDDADTQAVIDALRPLPSTDPVAQLEAPRFPVRVIRQVERARRLGSVRRVARGLRVSRARAAFILKFGKALEPFGRLEPADC
jgi:hypothetical protein